jgi:hypothetical protein
VKSSPRSDRGAPREEATPESQRKHPVKSHFSDELLTALRTRLPDYLSARGVELRKSGSRLLARCPNHDDRPPSFAVFGTHHETCGCYPCGFTVDVFDVSKWMGRASTFPEAVADVAASLGVYLPQATAGTATRSATAPPRRAKEPEPPFELSPADKATVAAARLRFSDAFWSGDSIVDRVAESLGLNRETLRVAAWGQSGIGLACPAGSKEPWLCYAYPNGLKWRNPDPQMKPRFQSLVGKATSPWRMEWVTADTRTVYQTEGESDCMAMLAAGLEADGSTACLASPGTSFQREWPAYSEDGNLDNPF